jgi:hypothetical protein
VEEEVVVAAVAMTAEPAWWWLWWRVRGVAVVVACGGRWDRAWALKTHSKVFLFFWFLLFFALSCKKHMTKRFAVCAIKSAQQSRICGVAFAMRTDKRRPTKEFVVHFSCLCRVQPAHDKVLLPVVLD